MKWQLLVLAVGGFMNTLHYYPQTPTPRVINYSRNLNYSPGRRWPSIYYYKPMLGQNQWHRYHPGVRR
jgi:hypothetical protein